MSLARAFTTKRMNKNEQTPAAAGYLGRAASQRSPNSKPIERNQISLPVALISTTNMLSYEAPDIKGTPRIQNTYRNVSSASSASSVHSSGDESDHSSNGSAHSHETAATSVDDYSPVSPEPNHLSCYFKPGSMSDVSSRASHSTTASSRPSFDSPMIPQRAPSHSKTAHVLSHKRSMQRVAPAPTHRRETSRSSVDMFNNSAPVSAPATHPFGKELEQLNEAAEEFGHAVRDAEEDADRVVMRTKGLVHFCANDYLAEISDLYSTAFQQDAAVYQPMVWI